MRLLFYCVRNPGIDLVTLNTSDLLNFNGLEVKIVFQNEIFLGIKVFLPIFIMKDLTLSVYSNPF